MSSVNYITKYIYNNYIRDMSSVDYIYIYNNYIIYISSVLYNKMHLQ